MRSLKKSTLIGLVIGDGLVVLAITLFGFESHNQSLTGLRWMSTFLPVVLAWGLIAPWFGLYQPQVVNRPWQVWRILPTLILATPLAVFLRSLWLGRPIIWVFALVLGGILMLAFFIWRLIWAFASGRQG
ncbi:hypothetical protein LARV_03291 [Longilinea arvoryzae]|uniref:DUF3054 domain-containing protein n=1 Tax=Longilinea arvoryzae TaxID=360412 RepID=A0A0S7BCT0_9CHLR|nr:DUF3054 domain-containing protein [Longilinea arvoryzae]GAP15502.1 hypothetical protein LARV_03291 [Longilinea arvoryzae]